MRVSSGQCSEHNDDAHCTPACLSSTGIDLELARHESSHASLLAMQLGYVQRSLSVAVLQLAVCASIQQQLQHSLVSKLRRIMKSGIPVAVLHVGVQATLGQQELSHGVVT